jgi:hypothetical protein
MKERLAALTRPSMAMLLDLAVSLITLIAVGMLIYVVVLVTAGPRAPLKYTRDIYCAERSQQLENGCGPAVYTPGDTLIYTASLTIERAGDIDLERGWRTNPAEGRPRLCNGTLAPVINEDPPPFSQGAVGNEVEGRIEVEVPDLPPGHYWLISSVINADGGEALTKVPVLILKKCDG